MRVDMMKDPEHNGARPTQQSMSKFVRRIHSLARPTTFAGLAALQVCADAHLSILPECIKDDATLQMFMGSWQCAVCWHLTVLTGHLHCL